SAARTAGGNGAERRNGLLGCDDNVLRSCARLSWPPVNLKLSSVSSTGRSMSMATTVLRDTADIRAKLLEVWRLVDAKSISATEARLHISLARALLETLKVEM